jgi:hypothetical protein
MFTVILFAVFLVLLWRQHQGRRVRLWVLPLLMVSWVNLPFGSGLSWWFPERAAAFVARQDLGLAMERQVIVEL